MFKGPASVHLPIPFAVTPSSLQRELVTDYIGRNWESRAKYKQEKETWEADFRALPKSLEQTETHYLGLVVALPKGDPLVYLPVEYTPTVNDLADLLADAMRRPLTGSARRPQHLHFRGNPRWQELFPHLKELGIEVTLQDELPELEEVYLDFLRQMRKASPGPIIMLSPKQVRKTFFTRQTSTRNPLSTPQRYATPPRPTGFPSTR